MALPHTMSLASRADWALMVAVHDVLRLDLDQPPGELGGIATPAL